MSPTQFKLTQRGGLTRRATFPARPSWELLSSRIGELYQIPVEKIGVSYVDKDGDEVTLSSEEELSDYFETETSDKGTAPHKFVVQDLRSLRDPQSLADGHQALPETPKQGNGVRNTFGGVFDFDGDWQLPDLGFLGRSGTDIPHAFVEVIEDNQTEPSEAGTYKLSEKDANSIKGKGRAYEPSVVSTISSTGSVLAGDAPPKPPVHVYDVSFQKIAATQVTPDPNISLISLTPKSNVQPIPTESTPKAAVHPVNTREPESVQASPPDPPLSSFDGTPAETPAPSLSLDIAALLDACSRAISSHPDISEGIRSIARNAANGTYFQAHRQTIATAAEEIARQAQARTGRAAEEVRRITEEEAGRRVAQVLDEIFSFFSGVTSGRPSETSLSTSTNLPAPGPAVPPAPAPPSAASQKPRTSAPAPAPPPPPIPPNQPRPNSWNPGAQAPFNQDHWTGTPTRPWYASSAHRPLWYHRPPPHAGPILGPFPGLFPPPPPPPLPFTNAPHYYPRVPVPPPPPPPGTTFRMYADPTEITADELKANLEETKQRYKTEKELYRQHREKDRDRRKHRIPDGAVGNMRASDDANKAEVPATLKPAEEAPVLVSNAWGPYPQLEMVNVTPRRNHTFAGRGASVRTHGDGETAAIQRVTKRLADMGFTASAYPSLPSRINGLVLSTGKFNKEAEDDIVTDMLEELLAMSPKPVASGSRPKRDRDIPGAWRFDTM